MDKDLLKKILENPSDISIDEVETLNKVIEDYPFFSSARILKAKGLKNMNSLLLNHYLPLTASYSKDRLALFFNLNPDKLPKEEVIEENNLNKEEEKETTKEPQIIEPEFTTDKDLTNSKKESNQFVSEIFNEKETKEIDSESQDLEVLENKEKIKSDFFNDTNEHEDKRNLTSEEQELKAEKSFQELENILLKETHETTEEEEEFSESLELIQNSESSKNENQTLKSFNEITEDKTAALVPKKTNFENQNLVSETESIETTLDPKDLEDETEGITISSNEKHSFSDWLKIGSSTFSSEFSKITAEAEEKNQKLANKEEIEAQELTNDQAIIDNSKRETNQLIDTFIEANPKIEINKDKEQEYSSAAYQTSTILDDLMTETLAKIYLDQKKFDLATKAYRILMLKYPEKSSLFASQIQEIEEIKKTNNKK